jgi:hypothetical protein
MSSSTDQFQRIADELSIRDLVARFANACSPPNYDAFATLWLPGDQNNPQWTLSDPYAMSATGIGEIVAMLRRLLATRDFFVQLVHSGVVEIDGDRATGRWIMREVAKGPGETYYNNFAIYDDEFNKVNGKWYFARRSYTYMFLDSSSFGGIVCNPVTAWFQST